MFHALAIVVLILGWYGSDASVKLKLWLTAIYLVIWILSFLSGYIMLLLIPFSLGSYFALFGSERGRRWRP